MDYLKILSDEFKSKNYYYFKNLSVKEIDDSIVVIEFDYQKRVSNKFKSYSSDLIIKVECNDGHCNIEIINSKEAIDELLNHLKGFVWATTGW